MKGIMCVLAASLIALASVPFIVDVDMEDEGQKEIVVHTDGKVSIKMDDTLHLNTNGTLGVQLGNTCVSTTGKISTCF